jgi:hypothetical protein
VGVMLEDSEAVIGLRKSAQQAQRLALVVGVVDDDPLTFGSKVARMRSSSASVS